MSKGTEEMEAMEYAYRWTNNVMGSWSIKKEVFEDGETNGDFDPNVTVMAPLHVDDSGKEWGLRSTSVGDQCLLVLKSMKLLALVLRRLHNGSSSQK